MRRGGVMGCETYLGGAEVGLMGIYEKSGRLNFMTRRRRTINDGGSVQKLRPLSRKPR